MTPHLGVLKCPCYNDGMDEGKSYLGEWAWRVTTLVHLTGVVAFGLIQHGIEVSGVLEAWGLLTLCVCPIAIYRLVTSGRIISSQVPLVIAVACGIEFTQVVALVPAIQ